MCFLSVLSALVPLQTCKGKRQATFLWIKPEYVKLHHGTRLVIVSDIILGICRKRRQQSELWTISTVHSDRTKSLERTALSSKQVIQVKVKGMKLVRGVDMSDSKDIGCSQSCKFHWQDTGGEHVHTFIIRKAFYCLSDICYDCLNIVILARIVR